jgi:hypothetical protein
MTVNAEASGLRRETGGCGVSIEHKPVNQPDLMVKTEAKSQVKGSVYRIAWPTSFN